MPCLHAGCGKSFGVFNRNKRTCHDCGIDLCRDCIVKTPATRDRAEKSKLCSRCNAIALVPLMDAPALSRATSEVLTLYLTAFGVSVAECDNKIDIIRLVVQTRNAAEAAMSFAGSTTTFNRPVTPTRAAEDDASEAFGSFGVDDEAENSLTTPATPAAQPPPPPPNLPSPPGPAASGLEGFFAEQLLQLLMENLATTEQTPRQTDEEYQQEQGEQRAKYQEMMKRRENANKLNTAQSVDEFKDMRVGTLKDILTENFVDHQHCLEKSELLDKVEALWREKQGADADASEPEDTLCRICYDKQVNSVFLECGHFCTCVDCGKQLQECPMCRERITRCVHVFR